MNDAKVLADSIQGLLIQLPLFLVAFIGAIVTLNRWKDAPSAGIWSLLGFGIVMLLCVLVPVSQVGVRYWLLSNSGHASSLATAFTALAMVWSILRAVSYIFLLVAIFAGRPQSA